MLRAIREVSPRWVVAENVYGLVSQQGGVVFEQVCASMEALGYEVQPFVVPACAVNAPHRRDRVWIVAHRADAVDVADPARLRCIEGRSTGGRDVQDTQVRTDVYVEPERLVIEWASSNAECGGGDKICNHVQSEKPDGQRADGIGDERAYSDPESDGFQGRNSETCKDGDSGQGFAVTKLESQYFKTDWQKFPTEPPVCSGDDGFSARLDGITFPRWREQSIKAAGNAVVPQVPYQIFMAIGEYEDIICKGR